MSAWEESGKSDEWYTPKYIFDALQCIFDVDVAAPVDRSNCHVPTLDFITDDSLSKKWNGFIWMNPPFGGRNGIRPWLEKMASHGDGIALTPDRTSATWWQDAAKHEHCRAILFVDGKIKFHRPDGTLGNQPSTGTTLLAYGLGASHVLNRASKKGLGFCAFK